MYVFLYPVRGLCSHLQRFAQQTWKENAQGEMLAVQINTLIFFLFWISQRHFAVSLECVFI